MAGLKKILLVDDEPEILVALSDLLEGEFRVLTAGSGAQGLEILAREPEAALRALGHGRAA